MKLSKLCYRISVWLTLFFVGGQLYYMIEMLYRGRSHPSMYVLGGVCFVIVGALDEVIKRNMSLFLQGVIGAVIITALEFVTGCIVNLWLKLNVWDYSNLPFNLLGQVCAYFFFAWIVLSILCVLLNNALLVAYGIRKSMPHYKIF